MPPKGLDVLFALIDSHPTAFVILAALVVYIIANAATRNSRLAKELDDRKNNLDRRAEKILSDEAALQARDDSISQRERTVASAKQISEVEAQRQYYLLKTQDLSAYESSLINREKVLKEKEARHTFILKSTKMADLNRREKAILAAETAITKQANKQSADYIKNLFHRASSSSHFSDSLVFHSLSGVASDDLLDRFHRARVQEIHFSAPLRVSTDMQGSNGEIYHVSLSSCTCTDFTTRKIPCKHMLKLALEIGLLSSIDVKDCVSAYESLHSEREALVKQNEILVTTKNRLTKIKKSMDKTPESVQNFPELARLYADFFALVDQETEDYLRSKPRPSIKGAEDAKQLSREKRLIQKQCKLLEHQLLVYENLFPWLEEFKELSIDDAVLISSFSAKENEDEYDTLRSWLSPIEYQNLPSAEKYQLALDRYNSRNKTNWEIGRDFERYIGYTYESRGLSVCYTGATLRFEDMGRDLIVAMDDGSLLVIQCKRYAHNKVLHEKHVFQLFGSITLLQIQNPHKTVHGLLVCTCALSDIAKECAQKLNIAFREFVPVNAHPQIKCNISRSSGEKIYHLPFDQQYDRVLIEPGKGEFFASTVKEAEAAGFRRAFRHRQEK